MAGNHWQSRRAVVWLAAAVAALAFTLFPAPVQAQSVPDAQAQAAAEFGTPAYAPGQILVGVREGATGAQAMSGAAVADALGALAGVDAAVIDTFDAGAPDDGLLTYVAQVPAGSELEAVRALQESGAVLYAEPNWTVWAAQEGGTGSGDDLITAPLRAAVERSFRVNDPYYASDQWYLQRISMSRAWRTAASAGSSAPVVVAVIDSGLDVGHPEFAGRMLPGVNYVGGEGIEDGYGHGTHIAGLIAAGLNDAAGIAGPAPVARIKPYKVLSAAGSGYISEIAQAVRAATDAGAAVINMSLQAYFPEDPNAPSTLWQAVKYASAKGVLMVAASGNNRGAAVAYPARYPEVMAVAALDAGDGHPTYSNFGPEVEVAAPGGGSLAPMLSTWSLAAAGRCALPPELYGERYCTSYGTSQATGVVSGVAALLLGMNPGLSGGDVRALLRDAATPLGLDAQYVGRGKVNAYAAARTVLPGDLQVSISQSHFMLPPGSGPQLATVRLDNPSLDPVTWKATLPATLWVKLDGSSGGVLTGLTVADQPDFLTLTISPAGLAPGIYGVQLGVVGTRADGSRVEHAVGLQVTIGVLSNVLRFPLISGGTNFAAASPAGNAFVWEEPAKPGDRTTHALTNSSDTIVSLPDGFAFPLRSALYSSLRIYSDGIVVFPLDEATPALPNHCMPSDRAPQEAIYGWWADLDPGAGGRVSTFALADRFVVEFSDVPSSGAQGVYRVSFQIVLFKNGDVRLSYRNAPRFDGVPEHITVGVEGGNGLFYNQLFCAAEGRIFGAAPEAFTSYLIEAEDIF